MNNFYSDKKSFIFVLNGMKMLKAKNGRGQIGCFKNNLLYF